MWPRTVRRFGIVRPRNGRQASYPLPCRLPTTVPNHRVAGRSRPRCLARRTFLLPSRRASPGFENRLVEILRLRRYGWTRQTARPTTALDAIVCQTNFIVRTGDQNWRLGFPRARRALRGAALYRTRGPHGCSLTHKDRRPPVEARTRRLGRSARKPLALMLPNSGTLT